MSARAAPEFIPGCDQETALRVREAMVEHGLDPSIIRYVSSPCGFRVPSGVRDLYTDNLDQPAPRAPSCAYVNPCYTGGCTDPTAPLSLARILPASGGADQDMPVALAAPGAVAGIKVIVDGVESTAPITQYGEIIRTTFNLPVGEHSVLVRNPDGSESNTLPWTAKPPLVLTSITPSTFTTAPGAVPVVLIGSGFTPDFPTPTLIMGAGGSSSGTTYVSPTELTASVSGSFLGVGTHQVHLESPTAGVSNELPITVTDTPPALTSVTPNTVNAGAVNTSFALRGSNFKSGPKVLIDGVVQASSGYINGQNLTVTWTPPTTPGTHQFQVQNGGATGPISNSVEVTVTASTAPVPVLTSIDPTSAMYGDVLGQVITFHGSNFTPEAVVVEQADAAAWHAISFIDSATIQILWDSGIPEAVQLAVRNGPAGSPQSAWLPFTWVDPPAPVLTSITPNTAVVNTGSPTVTIIGTGFMEGRAVAGIEAIGDNLITTYVSDTELTVVVNGASTPRVVEIDVRNGYPIGVPRSNKLPFTWT